MKAAVIGAGAGGLAAAKCLLEEGIQPVVFERSGAIGGLWNFDADKPNGGGPGYRSLRANTSRQMTAFSNFPFLDGLPDFPDRSDVLSYLNDYTDYFRLRNRIRLGSLVETVVPGGDAQWEVSFKSRRGWKTEVFDTVLVCSGKHEYPAIPQYQGTDAFKGIIMHSRSYKSPEQFEGKEVVVVGAGSSGADIAAELSKVAQRVVLSTAKGAWFIPQYFGAQPYDQTLSRLASLVPYRLRMRLLRRAVLEQYQSMGLNGVMSIWGGSEPEFDLYRTRLTPSSQLVLRIASGEVGIKPNVAHLEARHVKFTDDTRARADAIILCTGYRRKYPFLRGSLSDLAGSHRSLYKHVFPPALPNLAFVGVCSVNGPEIPVLEMQARWIARVFSGITRLPAQAEMRAEIQARLAYLWRLGAPLMRVQALEYMDEIAQVIGVRPQLLRHARLLAPLLAGPVVPAQYRLDGPGRWTDARQIIKQSFEFSTQTEATEPHKFKATWRNHA